MAGRRIKNTKVLERIIIEDYCLEHCVDTHEKYFGIEIEREHYIIDWCAPEKVFRLIKYDKKNGRTTAIEVRDKDIIREVNRRVESACADLRDENRLRETPDLV